MTATEIGPNCQALIARWRLTPDAPLPAITQDEAEAYNMPGYYRPACDLIFKGWTHRGSADFPTIGAPWEYMDDWSNGYRDVYILRAERAIFTQCEGDLHLTVDADVDTFQARLLSAALFYERR